MKLTPFQTSLLTLEEDTNAFLGGGKASGKTEGSKFAAIGHAEKYRDAAQVLIVRRSRNGVRPYFLGMRDLIKQIDPESTSNLQNLTITAFGGAQFQAAHLIDRESYAALAGNSRTRIIIDESGLYPNRKWIDMLRGDLRSGAGVPCTMWELANPGSVGHRELYERFIRGRISYEPYLTDQGERYVTINSTFRDNPHLGDDYESKLRAMCYGDEKMFLQLAEGRWDIFVTSAFPQYDPEHHVVDLDVDKVHSLVTNGDASLGFSLDYGSRMPTVGYLSLFVYKRIMLATKGGELKLVPAGSIILLDEVSSGIWDNDLVDMSQSKEWTWPEATDAVTSCLDNWKITQRIPIVADSRLDGKNDTLTSYLIKTGRFGNVQSPTKPSRAARWNALRAMLYACKTNDAEKGQESTKSGYFMFSSKCIWLDWFLQNAQVSETNPNDTTDTKRCRDDAGDAASYCITSREKFKITTFRSGQLVGMY